MDTFLKVKLISPSYGGDCIHKQNISSTSSCCPAARSAVAGNQRGATRTGKDKLRQKLNGCVDPSATRLRLNVDCVSAFAPPPAQPRPVS